MINVRIPLIILIALFILNCSGPPENGTVVQEKASVESGTALQKRIISISPLSAPANSVITLHVSDRNIHVSNIRWFVNDHEDNSQRSVRFSSGSLKKGDLVKALLKDNEKELRYKGYYIDLPGIE